MELSLQITVVLEIVAVNLLLCDACSERRYSGVRIAAVQALFTAVMVLMSLSLLRRLPFFGNGNGSFVILGFAYLVPIHFLYRDTPMRSLIVLCSAWVYTLAVFSVSVQVAYLLLPLPLTLTALVCQTALFLATGRLFLRFLREIFLYVLQNVNLRTQRFLTRVNLLSFVLIFTVHLSFIFPALHVLRVLSLFLLFLSALLSYHLVYQIIRNTAAVEALQTIVRIDRLTGLGNRIRFQEEASALLRRGSGFTLLFFDLDRFKSVNDRYGHQAGDRYLTGFCKRALALLGGDGALYRLSGDEFVCLYTGADPEGFARGAAAPLPAGQGGEPPFLGASVGMARFPDDADTLERLLSSADHEMYRSKRAKAAARDGGRA